MEPLILLIEPELDERAATATMSRAQKVYEEGARDISRVMRQQLTEGTEAAGRGFDELETKARRAYLGMQDAAEKVAAAERKHEAAQERGAANTEALARRVERARLDEIQAIERATAAYREYESAAQNAGQAGEGAGQSILSGLRDSISGAGQAGGDMAGDFVGGFATSSALMRLGAAGGPIGLALAGVAALGVAAGKVLADNINAGLQSMQMQDLFQARLGVDDATMAQYGESAANAYTNMFGASVEDNLRAVQFGVQGGVIAPTASDAEVRASIAQLQTLAQVMEVDVQEAARAAGQLMRGGFAADGTQAADIIATGFQSGLDISGDWLDTITEYSTQFRKLGLDGSDAIGLIAQGLQGAARDSDVVADSLKEFSIRAVDGSKLTADGFAAIGFNADEMAQRFLAGGDSARTAFDATLQAIRSLDDPIQQAMTWQALFGTQWEDMGDAINSMDLSTARTEFVSTEGAIDRMTTKLASHVSGWDGLGRQIDVTFGKLQKWLADSDIGKFLSQGLPDFISSTFFGPDISDAQAKFDAAEQYAAADRAMGSGFANAGEAQRARRGITPGADGLTPGPRTPILTETQKQAADAAGGGSESLPSAPSLPLQYTSTAGLPASIANATTRLDEARHAVAEKEARLNQLQQTNVADADDIQKAKNDLTKAQQSQMQAEQSLTDARIKSTEQANKQLSGLSKDMTELGNQLDADFGLSKGLGGVIENAVKAVGNALAAPFLAALGMVEKANPNEGSGLVGIAAANGMFGPQYTPAALAASGMLPGYTTATGQMGPTMQMAAPNGMPRQYQSGMVPNNVNLLSALEQMYPDLTMSADTGRRDRFGEHGSGQALDIMVGDDMALGDVINEQLLANADALGLQYNIWRQATHYPDGRVVPMEDRGSPTQNHMDHVHSRVLPGPAATPTGGPSTGVPTSIPGYSGSGGMLPGLGAPAVGLGNPYPSTGGNSGNAVGGLALDGAMAAAGAMDLMMPGAGAAAKIGIQLLNRTVGYGAQNLGILGSGALETLSLGDNPKGSLGASWLGKGLGGIAGAAAALPNIAGGKPPGPMTQQGGGQGQGATTIDQSDRSIHVKNEKATEDQTGKVIAEHQAAMQAPPGRQP